jgi:hypothetical protein
MLRKKPSALKTEHPALQTIKFLNFFYFRGSFLPSWIRILFGSGTLGTGYRVPSAVEGFSIQFLDGVLRILGLVKLYEPVLPLDVDVPANRAMKQTGTKIRIQIHMFLGHPDPDPLVRGMDPDPDPSICKQKW